MKTYLERCQEPALKSVEMFCFWYVRVTYRRSDRVQCCACSRTWQGLTGVLVRMVVYTSNPISDNITLPRQSSIRGEIYSRPDPVIELELELTLNRCFQNGCDILKTENTYCTPFKLFRFMYSIYFLTLPLKLHFILRTNLNHQLSLTFLKLLSTQSQRIPIGSSHLIIKPSISTLIKRWTIMIKLKFNQTQWQTRRKLSIIKQSLNGQVQMVIFVEWHLPFEIKSSLVLASLLKKVDII